MQLSRSGRREFDFHPDDLIPLRWPLFIFLVLWFGEGTSVDSDFPSFTLVLPLPVRLCPSLHQTDEGLTLIHSDL